MMMIEMDEDEGDYIVDDSDDPDCIHISATEQAGGFAICDECGEDVTREYERANQLPR